MATNHTPNYGLSQWEATDKVLRADFNADNLKIDGALKTLDTSLSTFGTALGKKLGRMEILGQSLNPSPTSSISSIYPGFPVPRWEEWDYIAYLVSYDETSNNVPLCLEVFGEDDFCRSVSVYGPGYLAVFLPLHDKTKIASGFIIADKLRPFALKYTYKEITQISFATANEQRIHEPKIVYFGGR